MSAAQAARCSRAWSAESGRLLVLDKRSGTVRRERGLGATPVVRNWQRTEHSEPGICASSAATRVWQALSAASRASMAFFTCARPRSMFHTTSGL